MENIVLDTISYVIQAPYFWLSMGFTTATAMFVGVLLYDGNMKQVGKGAFGIGSYAFFLMFTTIPRVYSRFPNIAPGNFPMAFAGTATILFVTLFYMLGLLLGVWISWSRRKAYGNPPHEM